MGLFRISDKIIHTGQNMEKKKKKKRWGGGGGGGGRNKIVHIKSMKNNGEMLKAGFFNPEGQWFDSFVVFFGSLFFWFFVFLG